ncbi:hypothetical protein ABZ345_44785 [Lentzea sp. NPDC005914]|uniref:hypothetical protein n=1 Tax=Lentzea sp. NPDC005914 TaxID=3154572 RepID=UPI0033CA48F2
MELSRVALVAGGIVAAGTFVPFTLAHGPTSYNVEHEILGWDMHRWGLVMGTVPEVLISAGLWRLRGVITGGRRATAVALAVVCATMMLFATMNAAFGAVGPPFDLFFLAPACVVLAVTTPLRGPARAVLAALAVAYSAATAVGLIPQEMSDSFGGFRLFGLIAYAGTGVLWAAFGAVSRPAQAASSRPGPDGGATGPASRVPPAR